MTDRESWPEPWVSVLRVLAHELARELAPSLVELVRGAVSGGAPRAPDAKDFLSVVETCERYGVSRATFDRMLRDPQSGLADVVIRVPPVTGRVRVPVQAFEAWLKERPRSRKTRSKA